MATDNDQKIAQFVAKTKRKLVGGSTYNHLNSILDQCGWKKRSATNLARIQAGLEVQVSRFGFSTGGRRRQRLSRLAIAAFLTAAILVPIAAAAAPTGFITF